MGSHSLATPLEAQTDTSSLSTRLRSRLTFSPRRTSKSGLAAYIDMREKNPMSETYAMLVWAT